MSWTKGKDLWIRNGREASGIIFVIRRALGTAVARNRLKRRLRSICQELESFQGSLVILPRASAVETSFHALQEELKGLVSRLENSSN